MTQERTVEGAVAALLNSRELVINRGSKHGVAKGDRVDIGDTSVEILDPETEERLGTVSRPLISMVVRDVQESLSVARTRRAGTRNVGGYGYGAGVFTLMQPRREVPIYESLILDDEDPRPRAISGETLVDVGDPVLIHLGRRIALQRALDEIALETDDASTAE